ncbi:hypothetical protein ACFL2Q_07490 [Thermodesulfobacteriota bacterium]
MPGPQRTAASTTYLEYRHYCHIQDEATGNPSMRKARYSATLPVSGIKPGYNSKPGTIVDNKWWGRRLRCPRR